MQKTILEYPRGSHYFNLAALKRNKLISKGVWKDMPKELKGDHDE